MEILSKSGINWSDILYLSEQGINWSDLSVLSKSGVNWNAIQDMSNININWEGIDELSKAGINWSDLEALTKAGINWDEITVLSESGVNWEDIRAMSEVGINWSDLAFMSGVGVGWSDLKAQSIAGINWLDLASMTAANINWDDLATVSSRIDDVIIGLGDLDTVVIEIKNAIGESGSGLYGLIEHIEDVITDLDVEVLQRSIAEIENIVVQLDVEAIDEINDSLSVVEMLIGNAEHSEGDGTIFGTLNGIQRYAELIGNASDQTTAETLFGRIKQAKNYSSDAYNEIQAVRDELGAEGAEISIYNFIKNIKSTVGSLAETIELIPTGIDVKNMEKNVIDALTNAVNESAASLGLRIDSVRSLTEQEFESEMQRENKLNEIKAMMDVVFRAHEEKSVVINAWYEME